MLEERETGRYMVQPAIQPKCENKYWSNVHQACEETLPQEQQIP